MPCLFLREVRCLWVVWKAVLLSHLHVRPLEDQGRKRFWILGADRKEWGCGKRETEKVLRREGGSWVCPKF